MSPTPAPLLLSSRSPPHLLFSLRGSSFHIPLKWLRRSGYPDHTNLLPQEPHLACKQTISHFRKMMLLRYFTDQRVPPSLLGKKVKVKTHLLPSQASFGSWLRSVSRHSSPGCPAPTPPASVGPLLAWEPHLLGAAGTEWTEARVSADDVMKSCSSTATSY